MEIVEVVPSEREHFGTIDLKTIYLSEVGATTSLTEEQEVELGKVVLATRDGGEQSKFLAARNALVEHNLRLVLHFARKYAWSGAPFLDLVQSGNLGLVHAASTFDYRLAKFSTHASVAINAYMQGYLRQCDLRVYVPQRVACKLVTYRRIKRRCEEEGCTAAQTQNTLMSELDLSEQEWLEFEFALSTLHPISLDASYRGDGKEFIEAFGAYEIEGEVSNALLKELLLSKLDTCLTAEEAEIVRSRYELGGCPKRSLAELGNQLGITQEAVRQREQKILGKLKSTMVELQS